MSENVMNLKYTKLKNSMSGSGRFKDHHAEGTVPRGAGCIFFELKGQMIYAGKAYDGIQKRLDQFWLKKTPGSRSARNIFKNRYQLTVYWKLLSINPREQREECRKLRNKWIKQFQPPWNVYGK